MLVEMYAVEDLKHIEGFSARRVGWLVEKITVEGVWTKPLAIDSQHGLVLDGQHRMEAAMSLGLTHVPVVRFVYPDVPVWSLRPRQHEVTWELVVSRAMSGDIYPYKTVKHRFPLNFPTSDLRLKDLSL